MLEDSCWSRLRGSASGHRAGLKAPLRHVPLCGGALVAVLAAWCPQAGVADAATGAAKRFEGEMRALIYEHRFDELESIAATVRETKARFPDGNWKLSFFYDGLSQPWDQESEAEWDKLLGILGQWNEKKPESVTARVALGWAQLNRGWAARGYDYATNVAKDRWPIFRSWPAKAQATFEAAAAMQPTCPDVYRGLLSVGMGEGWSQQKFEETFSKGVALEPCYPELYLARASSLMERWYGRPGDWQQFLREATQGLGEEEGSLIYMRVAWNMYCASPEDFFGEDRVSWELMKKGFTHLVERYPCEWNLNNFCLFSVIAGDQAQAGLLVERIGENPDLRVWQTVMYYREARRWARATAASQPAEGAIP